MTDDSARLAVQAHERLLAAQCAYTEAVLRALEDGVSVQALAGELGVSRQAVNQLRKRRRALKATPEAS